MDAWIIEELEKIKETEVQIPLFYEELPVEIPNESKELEEERGVWIYDYSSGTSSTG